MTDTDLAGRALPLQATGPVMDVPVSPVVASEPARIKPASTKEVFGRGLLLILGEMVQLVLAFALALYALACSAALLVKLNDAVHFMGAEFVMPSAVTNNLRGFLAHSVTALVLRIVFAIKLLDLVVVCCSGGRAWLRRAIPFEPEARPRERPCLHPKAT